MSSYEEGGREGEREGGGGRKREGGGSGGGRERESGGRKREGRKREGRKREERTWKKTDEISEYSHDLHGYQVPNPVSNLDHNNPHGRGGLTLDFTPECQSLCKRNQYGFGSGSECLCKQGLYITSTGKCLSLLTTMHNARDLEVYSNHSFCLIRDAIILHALIFKPRVNRAVSN